MIRKRISKYTKLTIKNFAIKHRLQPQLVHYYIRRGKIAREYCECCGTDVIDVKQAEEVFRQIGKIANEQREQREQDQYRGSRSRS